MGGREFEGRLLLVSVEGGLAVMNCSRWTIQQVQSQRARSSHGTEGPFLVAVALQFASISDMGACPVVCRGGSSCWRMTRLFDHNPVCSSWGV